MMYASVALREHAATGMTKAPGQEQLAVVCKALHSAPHGAWWVRDVPGVAEIPSGLGDQPQVVAVLLF